MPRKASRMFLIAALVPALLLVAGCKPATPPVKKKSRSGVDVPGRDIGGIPRPPDSLRLVYSSTPLPSGVRMDYVSYRTSLPASRVLAFYKNEAPKQGWKLDMASAKLAKKLGDVLVFRKEKAEASITVAREGGSTLVGIQAVP